MLAPRLFVFLLAQSAIGNRSEQPRGSRDLPAEAAADRIIGEKLLRALLTRAAGDVEIGIEQQGVAGRDGIGYHAEGIAAIGAVLYRRTLELLSDRGGLLA